ncbi:MAG: polyphosphate kinase 2 family protein [Deltaproteobacteria bacterium]|nr:polyphosphate kinase 2 family protein [Deltaproteobacteria bacterium]MDQ3299069.1 polyphosphate kinase 2 family protein [Myxococcota bacterium]
MAQPILFDPVDSPYLVGFDASFKIKKALTRADDDPGKAENNEALEKAVEKLNKIQGKLYAQDKYSVLLIFQALDAAGKDGTIRAILTGVNPVGCQVYSYKAPNAEELDHDFMWRNYKNMPERGRIGVWNRSHYEEVLVVRVHPEYLGAQKLPRQPKKLDDLWQERFESISQFEKHWARNGCVVLKFFLNVSQKEQHSRFLDRVSDADNHWKFSPSDMKESGHWDDYMSAYQDMLRATSKPYAPWYAIPADAKPYMRRTVAEIIVKTLAQLDMPAPEVSAETLEEIEKVKRDLEAGK